MGKHKLAYLKLLSEIYPNIAAASTEIINLSSIINLPKGTEHFISDLHGAYDAFSHVMRNGSGSVRRKIEEIYGKTLSKEEIMEMATLIYYPKMRTAYVKQSMTPEELDNWYRIMIYRLIAVCQYTASKYTRSKVRKALPSDFAYVIEELITEKADIADKEQYYEEIVNTIIRIGKAERCIDALGHLIQRLVVDHLHVVGDIYDRGDGPDKIMDVLEKYHSLDIQWGNHDILWMGAAAGQLACIANVVRICARYGNMEILEEAYGINILPLASFAARIYADDPCECFHIKLYEPIPEEEEKLTEKIHKAITVMQFKLEGQLLKRRPEFNMDDRAQLHRIDYENGTITIYGKTYKMLDMNFPTIDPADPYRLTEEEEMVIERLHHGFVNCERLQNHMMLLLNRGSLYKVFNNNLLFHGCIPLNEDGSIKEVDFFGKKRKGKALYDEIDQFIRQAFFSTKSESREIGKDTLWWMWCSPDSPLFGKDKMTTFERQFIAEDETHVENKSYYYSYQDDPAVCDAILEEFGLSGEHCHIINGHIPVKKGQNPIKAGGKLIVIDGGFSKAYQKVTGIAGYTMVYNSHGMNIVAHTPFTSREDAVQTGFDIHSSTKVIETLMERITVGDTDNGKRLKERISELEDLLEAYRNGTIAEKGK